MIRNRGSSTKQYQTYPDGIGAVYHVLEKKIISLKQDNVHFEETTVGERRFWDASVSDVRLDRAVLVPYDTNVNVDDLFVISGTQYEVKQKQRSDRKVPVSWLLSLSEAVIAYRIEEDEDNGD